MDSSDSKYDLLKKCIKLIEEYEYSNKSKSIDDFLSWATKTTDQNENQMVNSNRNVKVKNEIINYNHLIYKLNRIQDFYCKKIFHHLPLKSMEEFMILRSIYYKKNIQKSEAIQQNLMELAIGSVVLKRLIKNGLVEEKFDARDKRKRILNLTTNGKEVIELAEEQLSAIEDILKFPMAEQIHEAQGIFTPLIKGHSIVFTNFTNSSLQEIRDILNDNIDVLLK